MLGGSLGLVEAGQSSVVPLVQPPRLLNRKISLTDLLQDGGQGHLGLDNRKKLFSIITQPDLTLPSLNLGI